MKSPSQRYCMGQNDKDPENSTTNKQNLNYISIKEIESSPLMHQTDVYTAKYGSSSFSYVWWAWTAYKIFLCMIDVSFHEQECLNNFHGLPYHVGHLNCFKTYKTLPSESSVQWNSLLTWSLKKLCVALIL